jgi:3-oxoacyl-[acyl-carrier-protein] synthase-3
VAIKGISACVPKHTELVSNYSQFTQDEAEKFSTSTGVINRHLVIDGKTSSDLCFTAAEKLLEQLKWDKSEIDILVFASQTRDYILPSTCCILQDRLGLLKECITIDIPYGCSGWIYGLSTIASYFMSGTLRKGLLLAGDVITPHHNVLDKSSYPLFGDAGTATAIEFDIDASNINFHLATDGSGYNAIIIPDGGYRNRTSPESFKLHDYGAEGKRTNLDCYLNGMDVFSFAISKVPKSVKNLMERLNITIGEIDYFVMHQANLFLNETIRKKTKFSEVQIPYSLDEYGNTSCSSIPLTIAAKLQTKITSTQCKFLACGFGVGLSWGTVYFETDKIVCLPIIEI